LTFLYLSVNEGLGGLGVRFFLEGGSGCVFSSRSSWKGRYRSDAGPLRSSTEKSTPRPALKDNKKTLIWILGLIGGVEDAEEVEAEEVEGGKGGDIADHLAIAREAALERKDASFVC
jgi:hypothetical protein